MHTLMEYLAGLGRELVGDAVFKLAGSLAGGVFLSSLGLGSAAIKALFALMCLDFALGFYRAWCARRISGKRLRYGFAKFFLYFLAILAAHHVDMALNTKAEPFVHVDFCGFLVLYLVICDGLSIFRHLHCLGVPIPRQIIDRLESLRDCKLLPDGKPDPGGKPK